MSTGDLEGALLALLGKGAGGLSASTVGRLKDAWSDEHARWSRRDLSAKRYLYFCADGIHVQARLEDDAQCLLVIIGATPEGSCRSRPLPANRLMFGYLMIEVLNSAEYQPAKASKLHTSSKRNITFELFRLSKPLFHLKKLLVVIRHH